MTSRVRTAIKGLTHRFGYDIAQWPGRDPEQQRGRFLAAHHIDLVIDVGANIGQYGHRLRDGGYQGRILSFEPMRAAYDELVVAASADGRWDTIRSAVGTEAGDLVLNVAGNSISSSPLPMLELHKQVAPNSVYVGTETVPTDRLDVLAKPYLDQATAPYLKIDTQGYEATVLEGATGVLDRIIAIELELSLQPLYDGGLLILDTLHLLDGLGFELRSIQPGFSDFNRGEMFQADGIFVRKAATAGR